MDNLLTVTRLNYYIKNIIEEDPRLTNVVVKGEVSNLNKHYTGHYYFTLKDENSKISCMMFSSYVSKLKKDINNGEQVILYGYISCFEKNGTYQLYVKNIEPYGLGQYLLKIEELKRKLKAEGLFDIEKKKINRMPKSIGLITSKSGAAVKDFIHTITSRWKCDIYVFPCQVQGDDAHLSIVKRIKQADEYNLDTLIIGRGGGSNDDLICFNEEDVVRAVAACKTPVISAIGHQIDSTIVDLVSDLVAITPTDAGEKATVNINDLYNAIYDSQRELNNIISDVIEKKKNKLMMLLSSKSLINPIEYYSNCLVKVHDLEKRANIIISSRVNSNNNQLIIKKQRIEYLVNARYSKASMLLNGNILRLKALNPNDYLEKGYSIVTIKNNQVLNSINKVEEGDNITIHLKDGNINAKVCKKEKNNG